MSAESRQQSSRVGVVLPRLSVLIADAIILINKGSRSDKMTSSLLRALQLYKENRLGKVQAEGVLDKDIVEEDTLLNMRIYNFFTVERFAAAGVQSEKYRTIIINAFTNEGFYSHELTNEFPQTVGDLIGVDRAKLRCWRGIGPKTLDVMFKIFEFNGLC